MTKEIDIIKANRKRSVTALVLSIIVVVAVFIGVVIKLLAPSTASDPDEGIRAFRYFTVLSNIFVAFTVSLCIPYEIDGLRNHNYHLPRWAVITLFCAVCCVTVTFTVALCLLSVVAGFGVTMLQKANLYLHLISPLTSMILFIFIDDDHKVTKKDAFIILVPLLTYALVYWVEVFVIGEENGGWRDLYYTNTYLPYWVAMIALPLIGLGLANFVAALHNKRHRKHKADFENYYLTGKEFECDDISSAITKLAEREKKLDIGGEIVVPRRILLIFKKRYNSDLPIEDLCKIYIDAYLKK